MYQLYARENNSQPWTHAGTVLSPEAAGRWHATVEYLCRINQLDVQIKINTVVLDIEQYLTDLVVL